MRLLNAKDLQLQEFFDNAVPPHAILSHRWGTLDDEVSYEDLILGNKTESPGYRKIMGLCDWAVEKDYDWIWIDTCCIDKRSSAELSEAINSMFAWYQRSSQCVAYLADVHDTNTDFTKSDWFTRVWTLQELLAPTNLVFVSSEWEAIGSKKDPLIAERVSKQTGIPVRVLHEFLIIHNVSVARRMSWAANRRTTRMEDAAYSLFGIFDVNMPLIYGEGIKAFKRLQLHIMEQCEDESILAWREQSANVDDLDYRGLLATSPRQFSDSGSIVVLKSYRDEISPPLRVSARSVDLWTALLDTFTTGGIKLCQLRCARSRSLDWYLDVPVMEKTMERKLVSPCFIALGRESKGDPFSRVRVSKNPWEVAGYREWRNIQLKVKQAVHARSAFSAREAIQSGAALTNRG